MATAIGFTYASAFLLTASTGDRPDRSALKRPAGRYAATARCQFHELGLPRDRSRLVWSGLFYFIDHFGPFQDHDATEQGRITIEARISLVELLLIVSRRNTRLDSLSGR